MPSRGEAFSGCVVALVTPFHDGAVDYEALKSSIDFQIAQGVPVLSPAGTTGECPTLTRDEHERVIATVVEHAAGRARVLAGTGSNATTETTRMTQFAARAGADAALVVTPYYNRPTQEGLFAHFTHIAEAVATASGTVQRPLTNRLQPRARYGRTNRPVRKRRRGQGGERVAGSGQRALVPNRPDRPLGRRQPDAANACHRGCGCHLGRRQPCPS